MDFLHSTGSSLLNLFLECELQPDPDASLSTQPGHPAEGAASTHPHLLINGGPVPPDIDVQYMIYGITEERLPRAYAPALGADVLMTEIGDFIGKTGSSFDQNDDTLQWLANSVKIITLGRRVFTTNSGLLGLGPREMGQGDAVCLIPGNSNTNR